MCRFMAILTLLAAMAAHADLDRIDADGVTETGGDPKYARMLPRTGTNGLLSATLLPPVADWASQPIARLYYAAAGAPTQGNGSPQYPFNTLAYALGHMAGDSALLMAPGSYSGTATLASGHALTLFGVGGQVRITGLAVTADGSSPDTALDLRGLAVDTLTVDGGRVDIRLSATTVGSLAGSASDAIVTRMDMASRIGVSTLGHFDRYAGYPTAPEAMALVGDGGRRIAMSGARGVVIDGASTNTIAHLSDVAGATNVVYASISDLETADSDIVGLVDAERTARTAADDALSNRLAQAVSGLSDDIGAVSSNWGSQLVAAGSRITGVDTALAALATKESNDVSRLDTAISSVQADYAEADRLLRVDLGGAVTNAVNALDGRIPGIVDTRATNIANSRLGATTNAVIAVAVARADANAIAREANITNNVRIAQNLATETRSIVDGHTARIAGLATTNSQLRASIGSVRSDVSALAARVVNLETAVGALPEWQTQVTGQIGDMRSKINDIIDAIAPLTNTTHRAISLPSKL